MANKLSTLIQFYDSFWGRQLQRCLMPFWRKRKQEPTLALGFGLPWPDPDALYAIPTQYGGKGIVWPAHGPCQTLLVDPTQLPVDDRSVGTVWAIHMLDEASDLWINEVNRVLRHDGQLHLVVARAYHPLTRGWPLARFSKKGIKERLVDRDWQINIQPIMGCPGMLWYITAQKLPYYAVKTTSDGCLVLMQS